MACIGPKKCIKCGVVFEGLGAATYGYCPEHDLEAIKRKKEKDDKISKFADDLDERIFVAYDYYKGFSRGGDFGTLVKAITKVMAEELLKLREDVGSGFRNNFPALG